MRLSSVTYTIIVPQGTGLARAVYILTEYGA